MKRNLLLLNLGRMKTLRTVFHFIVVTFSFASCVPAQIGSARGRSSVQVHYDKFKGYTGLVVDRSDLAINHYGRSARIGLRIITGWRGDSPTGPVTSGILTLTSSSDSWRYLQCHELNLLVNDKRFPLAPTKHDGSVGTGYVLEFINVDLTHDQMMQIGTAAKIEGKLCNDIFVVGPSDLAELRAFVSHFDDYVP